MWLDSCVDVCSVTVVVVLIVVVVVVGATVVVVVGATVVVVVVVWSWECSLFAGIVSDPDSIKLLLSLLSMLFKWSIHSSRPDSSGWTQILCSCEKTVPGAQSNLYDWKTLLPWSTHR